VALSTFWIVFLSILGGVGAVVGIGWFVWWLVERRLNQKILQEMLDEIKMVRERQRDMQFYLDGIPEVRNRRKAVIYRDAFRAMREYKHDEAIKKFQEALPLTANPSERCAILNLIGLNQRKSGANRYAEKTFKEMLEIAEQAKLDEALAAALGNIGLVYRTIGEPKKALEYHEKALEIAKKIGNLETQASTLGNIGLVYRTLGEPRKALEYYQKALEIDEKIGSLEGQAIQLGNIGLVYYTLGEPHKALEYYQRAREIFVKIGAKHMIKQTDHYIDITKRKIAGETGTE